MKKKRKMTERAMKTTWLQSDELPGLEGENGIEQEMDRSDSISATRRSHMYDSLLRDL